MIETENLCHGIQVEDAPWAEENTNEEIRWWHDFIVLVEFYLLISLNSEMNTLKEFLTCHSQHRFRLY